MVPLSIIVLFSSFLYVSGTGEFTVLQSPPGVSFTGQEELDLSNVKNVLSMTLGFTNPETALWNGMVVKNPFNFAEAVAIVSVPGASSLADTPLQGRVYPLRTDESLHNTWDVLEWRISERFPTVDNLTNVYVSLDQPQQAKNYFGELSIKSSMPTEDTKASPDIQSFYNQIKLLDAITVKVSNFGVKNDGITDLYWFEVPGLHPLIDTYGEDSKVVMDAKRSLSSTILLLSDVFNTIYDDRVTFATLASDVVHTRRFRRQANQNETSSDSQESDSEYAVIFNIILWFSVALTFALLAVSIGIATMDPGRDSIIYRMTSNRMKKDN